MKYFLTFLLALAACLPAQALVYNSKHSVPINRDNFQRVQCVSDRETDDDAPRSGGLAVTLTTYWSDGQGSDKWTRNGETSTGVPLKEGVTIAADPRVIPYGHHVTIPGLGDRISQDTGTAVIDRKASHERGNDRPVIDVYFAHRRDAMAFVARVGCEATVQLGGNPIASKSTPSNSAILTAAENKLGEDTSDIPGTDDGRLACAAVVSRVLESAQAAKVYADSTDTLDQALPSYGFHQVDFDEAEPGDVIISPSESDTHGHCGIVGRHGDILSNDSYTATFTRGLTLRGWRRYFTGQRGLETHIWRKATVVAADSPDEDQ